MKSIPVTCTDITNSHTMFGPNLSGVQGGTVRNKPVRVETEEIYIPRYFYGVHKFVTLITDMMFVNGVPFLVNFSRNIQLFTVELILIRTAV